MPLLNNKASGNNVNISHAVGIKLFPSITKQGTAS